MKWLLLVFLLLLSLQVQAASLEIVPRSVVDGGVIRVHVESSSPTLALTRWNEAPVYLDLTAEGARTLLPVPLGMTPGLYPLTVAVVDRTGRTQNFHTEIEVRASNRQVERLSLPEAMVTPKKRLVLKQIARERQRLAEIYRRDSPARFWGGVSRPVSDPVGSLFGLQRILNGKPRSPHSGVDFRSPRGTPVLAPADGRVVLADDLYYTGRTVVIDHGGRLISVFAHLEKTDVQKGEDVTTGKVLGRVGSTGRSTGPHLHWSVRLAGERIDPLALLSLMGRERP